MVLYFWCDKFENRIMILHIFVFAVFHFPNFDIKYKHLRCKYSRGLTEKTLVYGTRQDGGGSKKEVLKEISYTVDEILKKYFKGDASGNNCRRTPFPQLGEYIGDIFKWGQDDQWKPCDRLTMNDIKHQGTKNCLMLGFVWKMQFI